jgi:hypothetical protein
MSLTLGCLGLKMKVLIEHSLLPISKQDLHKEVNAAAVLANHELGHVSGASFDTGMLCQLAEGVRLYAFEGRVTGVVANEDVNILMGLSAVSRAFEGLKGVKPMPNCETTIRAYIVRQKELAVDGKALEEDIKALCEAIEDCSVDTITSHEAALICRMNERAVRAAWKDFGLEVYEMDIEAGVEWIRTRNNYIPIRLEDEPVEGGMISVPFAKDGTFFGGACRRRSGYTVGEKGSERIVPDIYEALGYLKAMDKPRWRRPNKSGNWGIVSAAEWKTIPISDFV